VTAADVVIVGLGPAGSTIARVLGEAGADVVALEAGPAVGTTPAAALTEKVRDEAPTVRRGAGEVAARDPGATLMLNAVGGAKHLAAAQSYRLPAWTLRMRSQLAQAGLSPRPGTAVADWPVDPGELERYHERVERLLGVAGAPGPRPALDATPWTERMAAAAARRGWRPFPAPAAIRRDRGCTLCGTCVGRPCPTGGKALMGDGALERLAAAGRLDVRTGAIALEVLVGDDGRATGVRYLRDGRPEVQHARVVVLAAYVYENVRLLLLSRSHAFPDGLANRAGQVGRHFMTHSFVSVLGRFPGHDLGARGGTSAQATAVAEFDAGGVDAARDGFAGGSVIQAAMELSAEALARTPPPGIGPGGAAALAWAAREGRAVGRVWAQPEQLAHDGHRLDLDPQVRDRHGRPVIRATHDLTDDDRRRAAFLAARMAEWLREAGAATTWRAPHRAMTVASHAYGGTRMGEDPATSVVDGHGFAHEVPGLVVAGASTFPTTGGRGPTQTVEALAWRTADRLAAMGAGRP
jgi:gluconate 2-dehydrogenase alpha chain